MARSLAMDWFTSNRLVINERKTVRLLFTLRHVDGDDLLGDTKYLGVVLDSTLRWDVHTDQLAGRLCRAIFMLKNMSNRLSSAVLRVAYFALFESILRYGISVWGNCSYRHRIFGLQRRALRIVAGINYRDDCRPSFINKKILTFPSLYILEVLTLAHVNRGRFDINGSYHDYHTRGRHFIRNDRRRLTKTQMGSSYIGKKLLNKIPLIVQDLAPTRFKLRIKSILLQLAFYSVDEFLDYDFAAVWSSGRS